jgi:hypothetical protein
VKIGRDESNTNLNRRAVTRQTRTKRCLFGFQGIFQKETNGMERAGTGGEDSALQQRYRIKRYMKWLADRSRQSACVPGKAYRDERRRSGEVEVEGDGRRKRGGTRGRVGRRKEMKMKEEKERKEQEGLRRGKWLRKLEREGTIRSHGSHDHYLSHPGRVSPHTVVYGVTHSVPSGSPPPLPYTYGTSPQWVLDRHSLHNHWNFPGPTGYCTRYCMETAFLVPPRNPEAAIFMNLPDIP